MEERVDQFGLRWSVGTWALTLFVGVLVFILVPYVTLSKISETGLGSEERIFGLFVLLMVGFVFLIAILFIPVKYSVSDSYITIHRVGANMQVGLEQVSDVRKIEKQDMGFVWRTFGVGGFCGSYGRFYSKKFGSFTAYITNSNELVLIEYAGGRKLVISPERPEGFVRAVLDRKSNVS